MAFFYSPQNVTISKFYVWEVEEIDRVLQDETLANILKDYYEVRTGGNWEHTNILFRKKTTTQIAQKYGLSEVELQSKLAVAKEKLFAVRSKRVRPGLDDKILTSWNALMMQGYIDAYRAFGKTEYLEAALRNAHFLSKGMLQSDYRLFRNYKNKKTSINAFLDDYALLAQSFIALYEVTFDEQWLYKAKNLVTYTLEHFFDIETGMFFYTSKIDPALVARKKEITDDVIPASNSIMARVLHRLGTYLYDKDWTQKSKQMMHNMSASIKGENAIYYSNWCQLYIDLVQPPYEIAIIGDDFASKQQVMLRHYLPNSLLLGGKEEGNLELLKDKLQEDETLIYVCQNRVCKFPVSAVDEAIKLVELP